MSYNIVGKSTKLSIIIRLEFGSANKWIFFSCPFLLMIHYIQNTRINLNEFLFFIDCFLWKISGLLWKIVT